MYYYYVVVGNNDPTTTENVGKLLAILIAMQIWWYNAGHIARWRTSRVSLKLKAIAVLP